MSLPREIKRYWMWVGLLLLVVVAAVTLCKRWYWFFPTRQVSPVYAKYAGTEGLNVAFLKDYRLNDTLAVDVTLLEAQDSARWEELCRDFGIKPLTLYPAEVRDIISEPNSFSSRMITDSIVTNSGVEYRRNFVIFSYNKMSMSIFLNINDNQKNAIIHYKTTEITSEYYSISLDGIAGNRGCKLPERNNLRSCIICRASLRNTNSTLFCRWRKSHRHTIWRGSLGLFCQKYVAAYQRGSCRMFL